jgi:CHAD domain-containing protein
MAYRFEKLESPEDAVKRIATEEIEDAVSIIDDDSVDTEKTIHEARKRCKEIRGLIRIVRPAFEETYRYENSWFRDAARELAPLRDAQVVIQTFEGLNEAAEQPQQVQERLAHVHEKLVARKHNIEKDQINLTEKIELFRARMLEAQKRVTRWKLETHDFPAIASGFKKTYRRGKRALEAAGETPTPEVLHEWRKRVKYHWYHICLLQQMWDSLLSKLEKEVHHLSDLLGDNHDLDVLRDIIETDFSVDELGGDTTQLINELIDKKRAALQHAAFSLGPRIYAEKPKSIANRFNTYWDIWRHEP